MLERRRKRLELRRKNAQERLDQANQHVEDTRRIGFHLLLKAECLIVFGLAAMGFWRATFLGVNTCDEQFMASQKGWW